MIEKNNFFTGFSASIYQNNDTITIAFTGTDSLHDIVASDTDMVCKITPSQLKDARKLYKEVKKKYPDCKIVLTGHSLGGSLAQILGAETGCETVTFSAYGAGNLYGRRSVYCNNITNYGNAQDPIFIANIDNQIGKTIVLNMQSDENDFIVKSEQDSNNISLTSHFLESFGDLSKGVEYKKEQFEPEQTPLFKTGVEHVDYYDDSVFDLKNRILYQGEVSVEDMDDSLMDLFLDQRIEKKFLPTKEELDKQSRLGELIYVDNYIRSDGTRVSGYYRAYPTK